MKTQSMPLHVARELLGYDPATGVLTWKKRTGDRGPDRSGQRAGSVDTNGYRYVSIKRTFFLAQHLAWLLHYGEWPSRELRFLNGEEDDCRIENLVERPAAEFDHVTRAGINAYEREVRKRRPHLSRGRDLRKNHGIELDAYQAMFVEQKGLCAICTRPETDTSKSGRVKWLAVDHDHVTGAIRALLCASCNKMLGYACDDPARLSAAIDYLGRHAIPGNVIPLKAKDAA